MNDNKKAQTRSAAYKFSIIAICIFYALYFVSVPILLSVNANYQYKITLIPQLVQFMGKVFEVCGIAVIYAVATYSLYRFGTRAYARAYVICGVSAFIKCFFAQTVYWILSGGIPAFNNGFLEEFLWLIVLPAALEVMQFTVFLLIAKSAIIKFRKGYEIGKHANESRGIEYPDMDSWVFPFDKLFNLKNPLLRGCFVGGLVIMVSKVLLSVLEEVDMALNGLAIKTVGDALGTVARFASDIACGVLAYTVMVFMMIKAFELWYKNKN